MHSVLKALTAMKLTKEDAVPSLILASCDRNLSLKLSPYYAFLYQGSIGAAYNLQKLKEAKITHILTCAANITPRFPKTFKYKVLNVMDSPDQNIS